MSDESPPFELPDVQEGLLDDVTLDAFVADLAAHAEVLDVLMKGGPRRRTDGVPVPLDDAIDALRSGAVRAVQVRYRWDAQEWRDTLMAAPGGTRLVRMAVTYE